MYISLLGMQSKCGVQSKRKCEVRESFVGVAGFSACGCQEERGVGGGGGTRSLH